MNKEDKKKIKEVLDALDRKSDIDDIINSMTQAMNYSIAKTLNSKEFKDTISNYFRNQVLCEKKTKIR